MKAKASWIWFVLGAAAIAAALVSIGGAALGDSPLLVRAADASQADRSEEPASGTDERMPLPAGGGMIAANGVVEPADREIKVAGATSGRIAEVAVREGQVIAAGDVLVTLESTIERADLAVAEANVEAARAELTRLRRGNRREDIAAATSDADNARARAELSAGVLDRIAQAAQNGATTRDELDRAKRQAEADKAAYEASKARQLAIVTGSRREDIAMAEARLAAAEAQRDRAQAALDRLTVRAPAPGEILQVKVRAGEFYQAGQGGQGSSADPLVILGDTRSLRVRLDVDERDIGKVAVGSAAKVRTRAFPDRELAGKVVEIGRRMGRKNVRTDDPTERSDVKILEVVIAMEDREGLVVGQRVLGYIQASE